ncbi:MAG: PHP domain-containing protein [Elusimicrobiota bacterium]
MIDLQLHTTDSDGTWTWDKVLQTCLDMKLKAFAITDHDTIDRHEEIKAWGKKNNAMVIPGIELSTKEKGQTVHLLGYFLDGSKVNLEQRLKYLREERIVRNGKMIRKLQSVGVAINEEEVLSISGHAPMGRPHIARVLLNKGIVQSIPEAFERFLSPTGSAYFPKEEIPLKEGINLLQEAGAVTSVAHPGLLRRSGEELEKSLTVWKEWGLDGLEAIYPMYNEYQTSFFDRMCTKYDFIRTGGSDFHGENKPQIKIGVGAGNFSVPDELLEPLLSKRKISNDK